MQITPCRQCYGIKTQTFKNQRDSTLLLASGRCSVLPLLGLSPANPPAMEMPGAGIASLSLPLPTNPDPNTLLTNFLPVSLLCSWKMAENDPGRLARLSDANFDEPNRRPGDKPI